MNTLYKHAQHTHIYWAKRSFEMRFIRLCARCKENIIQRLNTFVRSPVDSSTHSSSIRAQLFSASAAFILFHFIFHSFIPFSHIAYKLEIIHTDIHIWDTHANIPLWGQFARIILMLRGMSDESRRTYGDGSKLKVRLFHFLRKLTPTHTRTSVRSLRASSHTCNIRMLKGFILLAKQQKTTIWKWNLYVLLLLFYIFSLCSLENSKK